jgi:hypothetical protein
MLVFFLFVWLVGMMLGLAVGTIILRAAVALYNRICGATSTTHSAAIDVSHGTLSVANSNNPYASPLADGSSIVTTDGVPSPTFGKAMGIVLVSMIAGLPVSLIVNLVAASAQNMAIPLMFLALPANFLIAAAVLNGMLPTRRFGTACLVQLLVVVISLFIVLAGVLIIFAVGVLAA